MGPRWFEGFFEGLMLDVWQQAVSAQEARAEVDFALRELGLARGARVLDVPCGLGRHSLELAAAGCRVTGIDFSREALGRARALAAARSLEIDWRAGDMGRLVLAREFDGAIHFGNSFGYLPPHETRAFLAALGSALRPGARLALDYGVVAESRLPTLTEHERHEIGEILFLERNRYDARAGCIETTYTVERGAERVVRVGYQWVHTLREVVEMLEGAGFEVERTLGGLGGEPFEIGSPYLIVVARRNA